MTSSNRPEVPAKPKNLRAHPIHNPQNTQADKSPKTKFVGQVAGTSLPVPSTEERPPLPARPLISATETISGNSPSERDADQVSGMPAVAKIGVDRFQSLFQPVRGVFNTLEMPWIPPHLIQASDNVKNTFNDVVSKIRPPAAFIETRDDCDDLFRKSLGREDLCSKCRSLPVEECDDNALGEMNGNELHWTTSLSRIIFHADWCRMCRLLLSMLVRPEYDPLKHPEVAPYIQKEIQGISMHQWVEQGWRFTDKNWPFGRSEYRHDGATNVLGPAGDVLWNLISNPAMLHLLSRTVRIAAAGPNKSTKAVKRRDPHGKTYGDGLREGKKAATKYPLSCALNISIMTRKHHEFPGLVFASLVGFGNRPGGDPQLLSRFKLRVTYPATDQSFNTMTDLSYGRILIKDWIDTSIMRQWLAHCEMHHGDRCKKHDWGIIMQRPRFLRLIDVRNLRLIEVRDPADHRFLALSYVWGQANAIKLNYANKDEMMQFEGLRKFLDSLPRTIVDAMELVRAIGEDYLWVDTLVSVQSPKMIYSTEVSD